MFTIIYENESHKLHNDHVNSILADFLVIKSFLLW